MKAVSLTGASTRFKVRVQPRATRTELAGAHGDALKIRLAAAPVEGAANRELIAFLAHRLGVPKSAVRIIKGGRAREKLIEVQGLSEEQVRARLR